MVFAQEYEHICYGLCLDGLLQLHVVRWGLSEVAASVACDAWIRRV